MGCLHLIKWEKQMPNRDYRDLIAWKKAFELSLVIYQETASFPVEERYEITLQLR